MDPRHFVIVGGGTCAGSVLYLRGITEAQRLAQQLSTGERVVVLGGGFIGCEVAASARGLGLEVTVLEMQDVPLQRVLGPDLGEIVAQIHRDAGVEVRTGERVESVRDTGTGLHITTDRSGIDCGALLVAVGEPGTPRGGSSRPCVRSSTPISGSTSSTSASSWTSSSMTSTTPPSP